MPLYSLRTSQLIPATLEQVWDFISSPANLKHITPVFMGFDILTKNLPEKMYPGMIISYHVRPLLGIKTLWVTEITHVKDLDYFVDEQRIGPYRMWHHEHHLKLVAEGVLMEDIVSYQPPFGFFGAIANVLFINGMLKKIFEYRTIKLEEKFGVVVRQVFRT
jgi:ligand-binding SRPBCC domain-containing protein